jgi:hypothetical protein
MNLWSDAKMGIYSRSDFNFSSTRVYDNIDSITSWWYQILQRNWISIFDQLDSLKSIYDQNKWKRVVICDDGIFSWDTISDVIKSLSSIWLKVDEIRCAMNFSKSSLVQWIVIKSLFNLTDCIDWVDERDFVYGTPLWWATVYSDDWLFWVPYIYNSIIATKKASIPPSYSQDFCDNMRVANIKLRNEIEKRNNILLSTLERNKPLFTTTP